MPILKALVLDSQHNRLDLPAPDGPKAAILMCVLLGGAEDFSYEIGQNIILSLILLIYAFDKE